MGIEGDFAKPLKKYFRTADVFVTGSGTCALYLILKSLKRIYPDKKTVILPAYTAPVLKLPCDKAGLKIALCDISLEDYGYDFKNLSSIVDSDVLCIVSVELFGIPPEVAGIKKFRVPIIDDAAQAMGSICKGKMAGTMGTAGIVSFHRGKNLSTYSGGGLFSCSVELTKVIEKEVSLLPRSVWKKEIFAFMKVLAISSLINPSVYAILEPFLRPFKSRSLHHSFECSAQTRFQEKLGGLLLHRIDGITRKRVENGEILYEGLKGVVGVLLHKNREGTEIAYNQFPLVFEDPAKVEAIQRKLWNAGIETTRQYLKPLHHHFDLGYREKEFPIAQKVSQGLLLFPTHYGVNAKDIEMGIDIIRNELE
ncbi:MAG: DegT/DnrJ/EryC1/StrS family aminotransferase [Deltaproteobacteria bacterium]|nr:DegT/DnrJ/EryC1/StrS family aminotransferase [Deltaproteobacteria bacterium]